MTNRQGETLTVLFTDLVGHSSLYTRLGQAEAKALILAHMRLMRQAVEAFGGRVVKTEGDSTMAAFPSASGALKAAVQMQQSQARFNKADPTRSLSIRVGLNTGEPLPEGNDLFGTPVILASRVRDEAKGGEILVSEVVRLIAGSTPGVMFSDMGRRSLKGIDEEVRVFSVGWEPEAQDAASGISPLQGRTREMARLGELLQEVLAGHGKTVFIGGELGVGKTRLAAEVSRLAASLACNVLTGRCYEMDGAPPYMPFTDALRELVRLRGQEKVIALAGRGSAAVAQLVPELGVVEHLTLDDTEEGDAQNSRHEALTGLFVNLTREAPAVLLLDDVQWADRLTILLIQHMARNISEVPLLLLITYREHEVGSGHPLATVIADLSRQRLFERVTLKGLDETESAALISGLIGGRADPEVAGAIFGQTQGNPFFIEELVTHLREEGVKLDERVTAEAGWSLPESLVSVVERRVERLGKDTRAMLEAVSVLGPAFGYEDALAISRQDAAALLEHLDTALRAGLVRDEGDGYRFSHGLIREVLYRSLTASQRQALHLRAAENLQRLGPGGVGEVAYHYRSAGPVADAARVAEACRAAGAAALEVMAWHEAILNFEAAVRASTRIPDFDRLVLAQLHLDLTRARQGHGQHLLSIEEADRAIVLFEELGQREKLADALYAKARSLILRFEPARALESLAAAQEALESRAEEATPESRRLFVRILEKSAEADVLLRHYPSAEEKGREAAAMAEDVGDPHLVGHALFSVGLAQFASLRLGEADAAFARCEELSDPRRSNEGVAAATRAAVALVGMGKLAAARQRALGAQQRLGRINSPYQIAWSRAALALVATLECDLAEAQSQAESGLREGAQSDVQVLAAFVTPCLVLASLLKGDYGAAESRAAGLLSEQERSAGPGSVVQGYSYLAIVRAAVGQRDECVSMLEKLAQRFNPRMPDMVALPMHVGLAEAAVLAGEARIASLAFDPLRQLYESGVVFSVRWPALLPRLLGAIAVLRGETKEAEGLLLEAEGIARESGAVLESALTAIELSGLHLESGNRDAARECLARCPGRETSLTVPYLRQRLEALAADVALPLDTSSKSHNIGRGV